MKKILVSVLIVLLLCLGLAPVLAGAPCIVGSSPVEKISLSPFIHVRDSNVNTYYAGIGYVDSVFTVMHGLFSPPYVDTADFQNTTPSSSSLSYISIYGNSRITINDTDMSSAFIYVYGSSQVTVMNSNFSGIFAYDSSKVSVKNNSGLITVIYAYDNAELNIINSTVLGLSAYNDSKINLLDSNILALGLSHNSYLNASNSTITSILASDFSTGQIINNCIITILSVIDAADISVDNSTISTISYGIVYSKGTLTINGNTLTNSSSYRYTLDIKTGTYPSPSVVTVSALSSSTVNITNNNTIINVYVHHSSNVYMENDTGIQSIICTDYSDTVLKNSIQTSNLQVTCMKHSRLTLQNVSYTPAFVGPIALLDQSSATIKDSNISSRLTINVNDQSRLSVETLNFSGLLNGLVVNSYDSSGVTIANVITTGSLVGNSFNGYDLSIMTINSSTITNIGYAIKSTGDISILNGVISGSYIITTNWDTTPVNTPVLNSIAVVGTDTATITNSTINVQVFLHNRAHLNSQSSNFDSQIYMYDHSTASGTDSIFVVDVYMYDTSRISGTNTTFFSNYVHMYDRSSAGLSNITANGFDIHNSATLTCTGSPSATSTIADLRGDSNYPQMANVNINNCTVTEIRGITWITTAGIGILPLLFLYFTSTSQNELLFYGLLAVGAIAVIAVAIGIIWRRRA